MSITPPTTPPRRACNSAIYTPSPGTKAPSRPFSRTPTSVDVTYQIVRIKPSNTDWLTPKPSDLIQIIGPVSGGNTPKADDEDAAAAENDGFVIPCAARLNWDGKSIHLKCLYYPSASIFTGFGECADETANAADEAERAQSVSVTMQDAISREDETGGEMVEDENVRDDDGNPFMVLHVNRGLAGSARLYCKKVMHSHNGLTDGVGEILGLDKSDEKMDNRWMLQDEETRR